ncbi:uncharacterized protein LOC135927750 isoform X2 [Gordionus sp. m RMFG-2023]|uniref:uncharacterized protein LOC135927750 isoform X2 n=1 Tax=Gordionus sp. m RMFG-2023 TaxID=3053472 RepID=UPI0031FCB418
MKHFDEVECKFEVRCIKVEEIDGIPEWIYKEVGWTTNDCTFLKICYDIDPKGWFVAVTSNEDIIVSIFKGSLIRNCPILDSSTKYASIDDLTSLPITINGMTCNQCNIKKQDHLRNIYGTNLELEIKETTEKNHFCRCLSTRNTGFTKYIDSMAIPRNEDSYLKFMDGMDIDLKSLYDYDKAIHGGVTREIFLKAIIQLSVKNDPAYKVKCIVAVKSTETMANESQASSAQICGYGIIRPRWMPTSANHEMVTSPCTNDSIHLTSERFMIIGPLYADSSNIANKLLKALLDSVPSEWSINVELTVPFRANDGFACNSHDSSLNPNFLYVAATKALGLTKGTDCYRMYKNDILETVNMCEENLEESEPIKNNNEYANGKLNLVPMPNILMEKVYSFVSSDCFLI